jgi:hypothetical protein
MAYTVKQCMLKTTIVAAECSLMIEHPVFWRNWGNEKRLVDHRLID